MSFAQIKIVTFDCDGVLFDTDEANRAYYNTILQMMNRPPMTNEQFGYVQMHTVEASLAYLVGPENLEEAHQCRRRSGYGPFIRYMKKAPHLEELLDRLSGHFHTAIATNRSNTMNRVLKEHDLSDRFELVVTALDVMRPKPAPEQLLKVLEHFGAGPSAMVYIGDSELDEQAAQSAEVPFVAFNNPDLAADYHVTGMRGLQRVLGV